MKVMILAAGRGERMRPLTNSLPKPLLPVNGRPMIEYTLEALVNAGFYDFVINIAHLGEKIVSCLGDGERFNARINYSNEGVSGLETAGGIIHALPLLNDNPFLVVNGDIASDFPFANLRNVVIDLAHLVLVKNPRHHEGGDFGLENNRVMNSSETQYTYSGIGIYQEELFSGIKPGKSKLGPLLRKAMTKNRVSGELFNGFWMDIGTRERLMDLENYYNQRGKQNV